jgi:Na+/pantothenate symporter
MFIFTDYISFFAILLIPVVIGLYHGGATEKMKNFFGKKGNKKEQNTFDDSPIDNVQVKSKIHHEKNEKNAKKVTNYVVANSSMSAIPVAFSIIATFFSSTTLLGVPAEIYQYGIQYYICLVGMALPILLAAFVTGPFFASHNILSVFEYLQKRFNSITVRMVGTSFFIFKSIIGTAIYIYGPATSLSVFTVLDDRVSIALIGVIATFYTTIGDYNTTKNV